MIQAEDLSERETFASLDGAIAAEELIADVDCGEWD